MLTLKNLTVTVNNKKIIKNFNFNFENNMVYAIMGPNGSGKSTLAYAIAGHPNYKLTTGNLSFNGKKINDLSADKRAKKGVFLSFQSPLSLTGVTVFQLLRVAMSGKVDPLNLKKKIYKLAKELKIKEELIERSLNDGASGGEKKKLEMLQASVLEPKFIIFDEIDTGVDVDALRTIAKFMQLHKKNKTYILITHYNRILRYIKPDKVLVVINGELVKEGGKELAEQIEKNGYEKYATT